MKLFMRQSSTFTANTNAGSLWDASSVTYSDHMLLFCLVKLVLHNLAESLICTYYCASTRLHIARHRALLFVFSDLALATALTFQREWLPQIVSFSNMREQPTHWMRSPWAPHLLAKNELMAWLKRSSISWMYSFNLSKVNTAQNYLGAMPSPPRRV